MIIRLLIIISFVLISTSSNGLCEIYKWKNDDGSVGCTDSYEKVPEQYRDQVEIKKYRSNEPVVSGNRAVQHRYDKKTVWSSNYSQSRNSLQHQESLSCSNESFQRRLDIPREFHRH